MTNLEYENKIALLKVTASINEPITVSNLIERLLNAGLKEFATHVSDFYTAYHFKHDALVFIENVYNLQPCADGRRKYEVKDNHGLIYKELYFTEETQGANKVTSRDVYHRVFTKNTYKGEEKDFSDNAHTLSLLIDAENDEWLYLGVICEQNH